MTMIDTPHSVSYLVLTIKRSGSASFMLSHAPDASEHANTMEALLAVVRVKIKLCYVRTAILRLL